MKQDKRIVALCNVVYIHNSVKPFNETCKVSDLLLCLIVIVLCIYHNVQVNFVKNNVIIIGYFIGV